MEYINQYLSGTIVPIAILFLGFYFLVKLKGNPFILSNIKSSLLSKNGKETGIRAVILALAGTLGVGNIVGVASAIALGGAGSVFWMWISAFLAMILKYSEVVLALLHRRIRNGEYYGGAMYYMRDYFISVKRSVLGEIFTFVFVIFCLINGFTMGGIIQANAISESLKMTFETKGQDVGIVLAFSCIVVFLFNGKRIFSLCEKLVPFVSAVYIIMSLIVMMFSYDKILSVLCEIVQDAFSFKAAGAGALGFVFSKSLRYGTIRGLFSNEAGCGTSPIAHATSNTDSPCNQGILGIFEVFIDTIIVCTMTAFVILINKDVSLLYGDNPVLMVFSSFAMSLGCVSNIILTFCICLFAFATIICWGYYGKECIYYLNKSKKIQKVYYIVYIFTIYFGAFISLDIVWQLADLAVGVMTLMNLLILYFMRKEIIEETDRYNKKSSQKRALRIR